MDGVRITQLPSATTNPQLTDILPIVQPGTGGITYKATFQQVANLFNTGLAYLPLAGGTMTGAINMGTFKITNAGNPTDEQDLTTKSYVDSVAQGFTIIGACRLATTANLTATYANGVSGVGATLTNSGAMAALSIDGVTPSVADRILVKNQSSALQNGVYTVTDVGSGATNWILTRATDYDQPSEVQPGDLVLITAGTTNTNSSWVETETVTDIGIDAINFSQFSASLPISVPNGGTGNTTFTPYSVICAGTSATNPFQNVTGTGTNGQVLTSNGALSLPSWQNIVQSPINQIVIQTFTSSGTYTPTAGTVCALIECIGPGGGGGGTANSTGAASGGGGGSGGRSITIATAASIGASQPVTIGTGGSGGAAGANNGSNGSTATSVGTLCSANPGSGGQGAVANTPALGGAGSAPGTGTITYYGNAGTSGGGASITTISVPRGTGGQIVGGMTNAGGFIGEDGTSANNYGAGGNGGYSFNSSGNHSGGDGSNGLAIIIEYLSV